MQRHPRTTEKGYDYGERQKKITFTTSTANLKMVQFLNKYDNEI